MAARKPPRTGTGPGRPAIDIDLGRLEILAALHCTHEELASAFGVSLRTIERRVAEDELFRETIERGRADGRRSLRRTLYQLALKAGQPNAPPGALPALLFLCKQPTVQGGLGMSDRGPGAATDPHPEQTGGDDVVRRELEEKLDRLATRQGGGKRKGAPQAA